MERHQKKYATNILYETWLWTEWNRKKDKSGGKERQGKEKYQQLYGISNAINDNGQGEFYFQMIVIIFIKNYYRLYGMLVLKCCNVVIFDLI